MHKVQFWCMKSIHKTERKSMPLENRQVAILYFIIIYYFSFYDRLFMDGMDPFTPLATLHFPTYFFYPYHEEGNGTPRWLINLKFIPIFVILQFLLLNSFSHKYYPCIFIKFHVVMSLSFFSHFLLVHVIYFRVNCRKWSHWFTKYHGFCPKTYFVIILTLCMTLIAEMVPFLIHHLNWNVDWHHMPKCLKPEGMLVISFDLYNFCIFLPPISWNILFTLGGHRYFYVKISTMISDRPVIIFTYM